MEEIKNTTGTNPTNTLECKKCHKKVVPQPGQNSDKDILCDDCRAKAKRNRIISWVGGVLGCGAIATGIIYFLDNEKLIPTGFEGVTEINDSVNVEVEAVKLDFNIGTASIASMPTGVQAPVSNIEDFKRVMAQNLEAAEEGGTNTIEIPVVAPRFRFSSSDLTPKAEDLLDGFVELINQLSPENKITLEGYACDLGEDELNNNISEWRTETVKAYLVKKGIDPSRIETSWYGKSRNAEFNLPDNAENRRVLIKVSSK